jgi:hypothetical protein
VILEGECFPEKAVWEAPGSKRPAVFRLHLYVRPAYVICEWNETGMPQMPRDGAIIFSDLIGKHDQCSCPRLTPTKCRNRRVSAGPSSFAITIAAASTMYLADDTAASGPSRKYTTLSMALFGDLLIVRVSSHGLDSLRAVDNFVTGLFCYSNR